MMSFLVSMVMIDISTLSYKCHNEFRIPEWLNREGSNDWMKLGTLVLSAVLR